MKVTLKAVNETAVLTAFPFTLTKEIDLSGLAATLTISDSGKDGGQWISSKYNTRDITIEGIISTYLKEDAYIKEKKELLYKICNPKNLVIIEFEDGDDFYSMEAYPVSFPSYKNDVATRNYIPFMLQLTAADPFIYKQQKIVTFSSIESLFTFPLTFNSVNFGETSTSLIKTINNEGLMDAPIEITINAKREIENPYFLNVYTQKQIKLNTILLPGDKVVISTGRKKEVSLYREGVKSVFFFALDLDSDFITLAPGDNVFRFGADTNEDFLEIQVAFKERLGGL